MKNISKKNKIRFLSFAFAIVLAICGLAISGYAAAEQYSTKLGITYERNLTELSEHINSIENCLRKGRYAVTSSGATDLSMKLWSEALSAKTCLSGLPTSGTNLDNTYKFLSQVGEFSLSLSKKISNGEQISSSEREQLEKLLSYARQINAEVDELCLTMNEEGKWAEQIKNSIYQNDIDTENDLSSGFNNVEDHLSDYPTMLYDGPFSDHILQAKAKFTEGKAEVTKDEAAQKASKFLYTGSDQLILREKKRELSPAIIFHATTATFPLQRRAATVPIY